MPLYEYRCSECGHEFEVIKKFSDYGVAICPKCDTSLTIENRKVSSSSFKLDGSGWFKEGYEVKQNKYAFQD